MSKKLILLQARQNFLAQYKGHSKYALVCLRLVQKITFCQKKCINLSVYIVNCRTICYTKYNTIEKMAFLSMNAL